MSKDFFQTTGYLRALTLFTILWISLSLPAQYQPRFAEEIATYEQLDKQKTIRKPVVFTGSSTIRMWTQLPADFPNYPILNRGFGGSTAEDLSFYYDALIKKHRPNKVFIYEGDNDVAMGFRTDSIIKHLVSILDRINRDLKTTSVFLICPKPSPSRWHLKSEYLELNEKLQLLAQKYKKVRFIDMWQPMLDTHGLPRPELFLQDQLHMNREGYLIWKKVLENYLHP